MKFSMIGAAFALALAPMAASAVTINHVDSDYEPLAAGVGPGFDYALNHQAWTPAGSTWSNGDPTIPSGSLSGCCDSPFNSNGLQDSRSYFSVGSNVYADDPTPGTGSDSPNTLTFGAPRASISILWGSIDSYNKLTVHTQFGADLVFTGDDAFAATGLSNNHPNQTNPLPNNPADTGSGSLYRTVGLFNILADPNDGLITSLTFESSRAAFEFALAPVPLPATGLMFGTALLLGGLATRRRKTA